MATPRADLLVVQGILSAHYSEGALAFKIADTLRQVYEIDEYVANIIHEINENMTQMRELHEAGEREMYFLVIARNFELVLGDRYQDIRVAKAGLDQISGVTYCIPFHTHRGIGFDAAISRIEAHRFNDSMCLRCFNLMAFALIRGSRGKEQVAPYVERIIKVAVMVLRLRTGESTPWEVYTVDSAIACLGELEGRGDNFHSELLQKLGGCVGLPFLFHYLKHEPHPSRTHYIENILNKMANDPATRSKVRKYLLKHPEHRAYFMG